MGVMRYEFEVEEEGWRGVKHK